MAKTRIQLPREPRAEEGILPSLGDEVDMKMGQQVEERGRHKKYAVGEECTKAEEGSEERQEDDSKEEYYIEEFSKWNDDKGELNKTLQNKTKKMMSTNKTISFEAEDNAGSREENDF